MTRLKRTTFRDENGKLSKKAKIFESQVAFRFLFIFLIIDPLLALILHYCVIIEIELRVFCATLGTCLLLLK